MAKIDLHNMDEGQLREEMERLRASRRSASTKRRRAGKKKKADSASPGAGAKTQEEKWREKGIEVEEY